MRGSARWPRSPSSRRPRRRRPGDRQLRRAQLLAARGGGVEALVDLEVDVRPAAHVGGGEDRLEGHLAVGVGLLHAAQVVLARDLLVIERVAPRGVAVPRVDRGARERRRRRRRRRATSASTVVGTPSATPEASPKLLVMSWRTTPLSVSTLGPLEPSPGYGPAVSSGISPAAVTRARSARSSADPPQAASRAAPAPPKSTPTARRRVISRGRS